MRHLSLDIGYTCTTKVLPIFGHIVILFMLYIILSGYSCNASIDTVSAAETTIKVDDSRVPASWGTSRQTCCWAHCAMHGTSNHSAMQDTHSIAKKRRPRYASTSILFDPVFRIHLPTLVQGITCDESFDE